MIINQNKINQFIDDAQTLTDQELINMINKNYEEFTYQDIANLLSIENENQLKLIFQKANEIKQDIYGNRVVIFAPLYISDYCANNCTYCGYKVTNKFPRRKLNDDEIRAEVKVLEQAGHKRLALEVGEDLENCSIDYILNAIDVIYNTSSDKQNIRRINVNVAATTVEDYKRLKNAQIGTYILFQETYNKQRYEKYHISGPKADYDYHITAFDRAMEAGIDDVGGGVLFGLSDYRAEVLSLLMHNKHLENKHGVGFHTVSVPRIKKAEGMEIKNFEHAITDAQFKKIVAILRIALPYAGLILSTRESKALRDELIHYGVSQISAGSATGVGGYSAENSNRNNKQFTTADDRSPQEVIEKLVDENLIPSYCTACYREGRTGDRFMQLAKSGQIKNVCQPNALLTLLEFALDYDNPELLTKIERLIEREIENIPHEKIKARTIKSVERIKNGERDLFL